MTTDMDNFASRVPAGKQPHYWVCVDTNAHTGTAPDFIRLNGHGISSEVQALDQLPADLKMRANLCTHKVDVRGKQQLDFCKDNELLILNGRAPDDTSGKVTFVGRGARSPIDYHMASAWLASCTQQLEVLDRASGVCRVCSDHLPVRVCFQLPSAVGELWFQRSSSHQQSRACQTSDSTRVKQRFGNRTLQRLQSGCGYRMQ